ncbi:hypothetical protein AAVH_24449 [Aphelenchoides avenae]|nr:hypothetical protein AAVH_24449 [Aphelenchus avenae]
MGPIGNMLIRKLIPAPPWSLSKTTSDLYVLSYSLYGLTNATLTVFFVAAYRGHLKRLLFGAFGIGRDAVSTSDKTAPSSIFSPPPRRAQHA